MNGSAKELDIKAVMEVSNSAVIELKIDPAIVLASRKYVDDSISAHANKSGLKAAVRVATTANIAALSGL